MEQCETEGCSGVVFKQHLCLVCANKLFDIATSSEYQGVKIVEDHSLKEDEFKMVATSSDELVKEIDDYFNLSFLGDHVSRMQQVAELLQKCRSALEAANE